MKKNYRNSHYSTDIPTKGVMFLGGHPNLVKKLKQVYPKWDYVSDEQLRHKSSFKQDIIFYWTGHGSHQLMEYVYARTSYSVKIIYVTATNLSLLMDEMSTGYSNVTAS